VVSPETSPPSTTFFTSKVRVTSGSGPAGGVDVGDSVAGVDAGDSGAGVGVGVGVGAGVGAGVGDGAGVGVAVGDDSSGVTLHVATNPVKSLLS